MQTGIPLARIELLNAAQVAACNAYSKLSLPETPLLLLEFHGTEADVAEQSRMFAEIAKDCGGEKDLATVGLISPIVGHVGDGNFHCSLLCDVNDPDEMQRAEGFLHRLVERAQAMDGTCTGEHGIGQGKQKYLEAELGPEAVQAMRALKLALDPHNILNPGKILPPS